MFHKFKMAFIRWIYEKILQFINATQEDIFADRYSREWFRTQLMFSLMHTASYRTIEVKEALHNNTEERREELKDKLDGEGSPYGEHGDRVETDDHPVPAKLVKCLRCGRIHNHIIILTTDSSMVLYDESNHAVAGHPNG